MKNHRFHGIKEFTRIAVLRHGEGDPFKPAGCKGNLSAIYYDETAPEGFGGSIMAFGTLVRASCLPEYIYTINHLLDMGAEIKHISANFGLGGLVTCTYLLDQNTYAIQKAKLENENASESAKAEDEPSEEVAESVEKDLQPTNKELPEVSAGDSQHEEDGLYWENPEGDVPDWDYAETLTGTTSEKKNALKDYASTFGIKLSKAKKFENMLKQFKKEWEVSYA